MGAAAQEAAAVDHGRGALLRKLLTSSLPALFTLSLFYFIFYSPPSFISYTDLFAQLQISQDQTTKNPPLPPPQAAWLQCNYSDGKWVWDDGVAGPRYDSEHCDMKATEKCVVNSKPDNGYLHWRWQPAGCSLPALDPAGFLRLVRGKHLAFVGDSTARNQAEALVCFLSTVARPEAAHRYEERLGRKFWRWVFPPPHGVNVSTYWSPFLVRSEGHSQDYAMAQDTVVLDALTEPWAADVAAMDVMVISAGHWFPRPAMYYEDGVVVGAHSRPDVNETDTAYPGVFRKVLRRTLEYVDARSSAGDKLVVVATVAPAHFDPKHGWNHRDACSRAKPFEEGEAEVKAEDAELRKAVLEEVAAAAAVRRRRRGLRYEVLDVTRLATMRPDGHPGPYLFPYSYYSRPVPETVANDCLHWCAPGVVDTFNDILMRMIAAGG
ncbi:hypothetical protein ACP70R_041535 [Stipagrostis hirtigluma subsp. patula]